MKDVQLPLVTIVLLSLFACRGGGDPSALKLVQEQRSGDYTVRLLSETGTIKQGSSGYTLEFLNKADNQLADVGAVEVAPVMDMPGMGPMMGAAEVKATSTPGRYEVRGNLSMGGLWKMDVRFGAGQKARFTVNAE
ncbi:MAG TPA: FixH family protein [Terriglobia bacterium]|nr:FixH family protein [Terriglobia bacterium]